MRTIILTFLLTFLFINVSTIPAMAYPQYSEESKKLGREAGLEYDVPLDEIMRRQEALKSGKAIESTTTSEKGQNKANSTTTRRIKGGVDEYRVVAGGGKDSTQVTDTKDELHVYSNEYANGYNNANYGAKNSYDEFHTAPYDIGANDGYDESTFGELHINRNYRQNVYYDASKENQRIKNFDEFRYVWELN